MPMAEHIDRGRMKREANAVLRDAQVSPWRFYALFLILTAALNLVSSLAWNGQASEGPIPVIRPLPMFVQVLAWLAALLLQAGCWLYAMAIRRGERTEYLTLFDGFSFAGRIILLTLAEVLFITLWSFPSSLIMGVLIGGYGQEIVLASPLMILLILPPLTAWYRYQFAILDLCENPSLGAMGAIALSKRQTMGYKRQLLLLDLSFLGWTLLESAPLAYLYAADFLASQGISLPLPPDALSLPLQLIVPIVVGCLYVPRYQSMKLGYFETAKRTSGVTAENWDSHGGPDDLGGYF